MQDLAQTDKEQSAIRIEEDLIHLVSHQLLNCAGSLQIIYYLCGEADTLSAAHKAETLQVLQQEVNFLHRLGRYVLQLDLTNNDGLPLNLNPVNMVDLIKQMMPSFRLQGPNREFESHYEADLPLVWGDAERLQDEYGWKVHPLKSPPFILLCFWPIKSSQVRTSPAILIH